MSDERARGVLVTGASGGIGRAIAQRFASGGDRVAVHYASRKDAAAATLESLEGSGHVLVEGDIADPDAAATVVAAAVDGLGGLDVVVNNAAHIARHPLPETSYADWQAAWQRVIGVNVFGAANVAYCAARHMIEHGKAGRIVNVGSRGAYRGEPGMPAYGASKAALHSLGQSLAVSLGPYGIGVASVAPGFTATERVADMLSDTVREQSPLGRVAEPGEVASAVAYLASPEAVWSSGAVLDVNGASYLR
ncbi:SDR family NAD(P)-dependent oxidoreductase [Streptomonospora litoralis]|uniref:3-oxoacyl-[acyl-carrier-protein] reductase FabG n=1 Tax=Streptomonospora litoralis TaxID=2498135 RepID=A0A4P6PW34_9ACTN|nr:SDR family oxidoreductase [Streptomonospora litoralis]QBI52368.1 3-oxoacyl-[acyl-carrier-protein] reductase FabG [Streptomonospora litoralis]